MDKTKQNAIDHYDRMIEYVEALNQLPKSEKMLIGLGETWYSEYCSYCMLRDGDCSSCELCESQDRGCCGGIWMKMSKAKRWKTWLKYAKLTREYIIENG